MKRFTKSVNCERCDSYISLHQFTNYPSIKRFFNKLKKLFCIDCIDGGYVRINLGEIR